MRNLIFACLLCLLIVGCAAPAKEPDKNIPLQYMGTQFKDITVPGKMTLLEDKSVLLHTGSFIGGSLVYSGTIKKEDLAGYFKESMPTIGWKFVGSSYTKENILLAFIKPARNCIIHISSTPEQEGFSQLHVSLGIKISKDEDMAMEAETNDIAPIPPDPRPLVPPTPRPPDTIPELPPDEELIPENTIPQEEGF